MRTQLLILFVCGAAIVAPAPSETFAPVSEREEISRTFQLSPGARVEVSSISGSVEVEVVDSATAEVHVVRSSPSQADLDCAPMIVEGSPDRLVVRVEQRRGSGCRNVRRSEEVRLRLPASVDLSVGSVSGDVTIGRLEGAVRVGSVSGSVRVGGASGELEVRSVSGDVEVSRATGAVTVTSVSGTVRLTVADLERGIRVNSVSGDVELRLAGRVDADVRVDSISGGVSSEMAGASIAKVGSSSYAGRLGSGGVPITLSSISGSVRFMGQ